MCLCCMLQYRGLSWPLSLCWAGVLGLFSAGCVAVADCSTLKGSFERSWTWAVCLLSVVGGGYLVCSCIIRFQGMGGWGERHEQGVSLSWNL